MVSEAGCSEFTGRVLSPEICTVVVREDNPEKLRGKPTVFIGWKAVVRHAIWQVCEHHRDLRPGHVNRGVTGELERSDRILIHKPDIGNTGIPKCPAFVGSVSSLQASLLGTQTNRRGKSGTGEQVNNGGPQDVRLEVLADHSTDVHSVVEMNGKVAND